MREARRLPAAQLLMLPLLVTAGCWRPLPGGHPGEPPAGLSRQAAVPVLAGQVDWRSLPHREAGPGLGERTVHAGLVEIANAATVALLDVDSGASVATTVTRPDGAFSLSLAGWRPAPERPFALEATKGLALGGQANRAGAPVARLRTIVSLESGTWTSLSGPAIRISRSSTAIAAGHWPSRAALRSTPGATSMSTAATTRGPTAARSTGAARSSR